MHLLYYDEVKHDPPNQTSYWLGGIAVPSNLLLEIEEQINSVADRAFGSRMLTRETEFHGIEICRGKGNFKGRDFDERLAILVELLAIAAREDIFRLRIKINPANIIYAGDSPAEIAFMFLVEAAEVLFTKEDSIGMLFGDYDEPAIGKSVANLSHFRNSNTFWARGKEINRIADTVHFAKSHHSRLIQLADIFLYCSQFLWGENDANWRKAIADKIRESGILKCAKVKDWPQEARWYR